MNPEMLTEDAWQRLGDEPLTDDEMTRLLAVELFYPIENYCGMDFESAEFVCDNRLAPGLIAGGWRRDTTPEERAKLRNEWAEIDDPDD